MVGAGGREANARDAGTIDNAASRAARQLPQAARSPVCAALHPGYDCASHCQGDLMELPIAVVAILGAVLVGVISPGPSFVLVARTAVAVSRSDGIAAALGMGLGGLIFAAAALLGLQAVLTAVPSLHLGLKIAGAAYLIYLAVRLWRGAGAPIAAADVAPDRIGNWRRSLVLGLATQLSNPKTAMVYASIFTALMPADQPEWLGWLVLPSIFAIEAGWYAIVAMAFSSERPRRGYLRSKRWIDRAAGAVMGLLAAKLIWETR
jgi:threonine/homoserine/homoserine lactone efflux protein